MNVFSFAFDFLHSDNKGMCLEFGESSRSYYVRGFDGDDNKKTIDNQQDQV